MTLVKTFQFRFFIAAINALTTECRMHFDERGISTKVVDTANVGMISALLPVEGFTPRVAGFDICKIHSFLKDRTSEFIDISLESSEILVLKDGPLEYQIKLIEDHSIRRDPHEPEVELPVVFSLFGEQFAQAVSDCSRVSDKIILRVRNKIFEAIGPGDTDRARIELCRAVSLPDGNGSKFSLDYLKDFAKIIKESDSVLLEMNEDHPIRLSFEHEGVEVYYFLAPRVQEDEKEDLK